jgi:hypothetical protein
VLHFCNTLELDTIEKRVSTNFSSMVLDVLVFLPKEYSIEHLWHQDEKRCKTILQLVSLPTLAKGASNVERSRNTHLLQDTFSIFEYHYYGYIIIIIYRRLRYKKY